jgi:hypothetical protein
VTAKQSALLCPQGVPPLLIFNFILYFLFLQSNDYFYLKIKGEVASLTLEKGASPPTLALFIIIILIMKLRKARVSLATKREGPYPNSYPNF